MTQLEFERRRKKLSQAQLGNAARIHQTFISEIERGVGLPTLDQQQRLARVLDVPVESLLLPVEAAVQRG